MAEYHVGCGMFGIYAGGRRSDENAGTGNRSRN